MSEELFDNAGQEKEISEPETETRQPLEIRTRNAYFALRNKLLRTQYGEKSFIEDNKVYNISYIAFHLDLEDAEAREFMSKLEGFAPGLDKAGQPGYKIIDRDKAVAFLEQHFK